MILAVDIGNTSISFGVFEKDELIYKFKLSSHSDKSPDEYATAVTGFLKRKSIDISDIKGVSLLSVVPSLQRIMVKAFGTLGITPLVLGRGVKTGINLRVEVPTGVGADIVAEAVGALLVVKAPVIIADLGTATTISVINENCELCGCAIAPGIRLSADALSSSCALLSDVFIEAPRNLLGKNTPDSINSGIVWGSVFMLDGFINKIKEEYGFQNDVSVIASGGLSELIAPLCENRITNEPDLTLKGLSRIYNLNKSKI